MDPVSREKFKLFSAPSSCFLVLSRISNDACLIRISYPEKFHNDSPETKRQKGLTYPASRETQSEAPRVARGKNAILHNRHYQKWQEASLEIS